MQLVSTLEKAASRGWTETVNKICSIIFKTTNNDDNLEVLGIKLFCMMKNASKNSNLDSWMIEELEKCNLSQRKEIVSKKFLVHLSTQTSFSVACEKGNVKLIEYFIKVCTADIINDSTLVRQGCNQYSATSIGIAAAYGNLEAVKTLMRYGANVDSVSNTLDTPIMLSILNNHLEVTKHLAMNNADIFRQNIYGKTCLMLSSGKSVEMHTFLLKHEAQIMDRDMSKKRGYFITPKILAEEKADQFLKQDFEDSIF